MSILWIFVGYLFGSLPFGYIFSKMSGKDPRDVGWRKTSGSNVFKNVGKWQGVATGLFDVAKGFFAVYLAQLLGFSVLVQVLAGAAAVAGHNWSIFLKFSGGRGIGTFIGAMLPLSLQFFWIFLVSLLALALAWNAAIGTIVGLFLVILFSIYYGAFSPAGLFTVSCLPIIFIKRLSPIKEIKPAENKFYLVASRLLFDDDQPMMQFRLKKVLQKVPKPLANTVVVPTKLGWRAAKFGATMAAKPVKALLGSQEKHIFELKPDDLKKMMIASAKKIMIHQEEINKINVFPVADKDTGYNFAATLLGVEGIVSHKNYRTLRELAKDMKEAAMINARGNAGMIFTGYLIEVLERVKHLESIDANDLAYAMRSGIKGARRSVVKPVEGTVLDVVAAAGNKAFEITRQKDKNGQKRKNIIKVLEEAHLAAQLALKETPEKLAVLKQNNVVDAGGLGFVKILEAWIENLKGQSPAQKTEIDSPVLEPAPGENLEFRYEVVMSFKNTGETDLEKIQQDLAGLGDSLEVIEMDDAIKLHIHTNEPETVVNKYKNFPEFEQQTEDMSGQAPLHTRKPLGLVVDQVADLPKEFLEKYDILEVPFSTRFPDGQIINSKEEIYSKMQEATKKGKHLPTTSAPTFKDFLSVYQKAFLKFEKFLVITVSSKLSGAYSSARIARSIYKKPDKLNIHVFDCASAEAGESLVAAHAQDLILQGKSLEETVEDLKKFCPKITLIACVDDFRYLISGGRVRLPKIFVMPIALMQKIGLRLIIGLKMGGVKIYGLSLGKNVSKILADRINEQRKGKEIVAAIAHADNEKEAKELKAELEGKGGIKVLFVSSASPVVATHTGPGALIAAFYPAIK